MRWLGLPVVEFYGEINDELEKELQAEPEPIREIKHSEKTGSIYIEPYSIYPMV